MHNFELLSQVYVQIVKKFSLKIFETFNNLEKTSNSALVDCCCNSSKKIFCRRGALKMKNNL